MGGLNSYDLVKITFQLVWSLPCPVPSPAGLVCSLSYISCLQIAGPGSRQLSFSQILGGREGETQPVIVWCLDSQYQLHATT